MAASIYENLVMNECCIFEWGSNYKPDGDKLADYQSSYKPWKDNPVDHVTPPPFLAIADGTTEIFLSQWHPTLHWIAYNLACCEEHSQETSLAL